MSWCESNYYINDLPFTLKNRHPLVQIYLDPSKDITITKSAQCGASEYCVGRALHFTEIYRENALYLMPAKDQIKDFAQGRVDPRIDSSPHLLRLVLKTDNVGLKQIRSNFLYLRGSQSKRQIKSVDAGLLIFDEYDEMIQMNIPIAEKRLGDSKHKLIIRISTPTVPEFGIHREYLMSDQRE